MKRVDPNYFRTIALLLVAVAGATLGDTFAQHRHAAHRRAVGGRLALYGRYFARALTSPWWSAASPASPSTSSPGWYAGGIGIYPSPFRSRRSRSCWPPSSPASGSARPFSPTRWIGTFVIIVGVGLVAWTGSDQVSSVPRRNAPSHPAQPLTPARDD